MFLSILTQLLVEEFFEFTRNGHNFCFSAVTSFVLKIEKIFFLALVETWLFSLI